MPTLPASQEPDSTRSDSDSSSTSATLATQEPTNTTDKKDSNIALPRGYLFGIGIANFGIHLALMTPIVATMSLRVRHIAMLQEGTLGTQGAEDLAATQLGLILGIGAICAMIANPLFGRLSDRTTSKYGRRRPWIVGGAALLTLSLLVICLTTSHFVVLIAWCFSQISGNAAFAAMNATIPDQSPKARRGQVSGVIGVASPIAILVGSGLSQALSDDADLGRFMIPAAIGLLAAIAFAFILRDKPLEKKPSPFSWHEFWGSFYFNPIKHPNFGWVWLSKFAVTFGFVGIQSYLTYFLIASLAIPESDARKLVFKAMLVMVAATVFSALVAGKLSDKFQKRRIFVAISGLLAVAGVLMLAIFPSTLMVVVSFGVIGLGQGAFNAVDLALATQVLPSDKQAGKDMGLISVASSSAQALSPLIAPLLIGLGGGTAGSGYLVFFLLGALISATGALLVFKVKDVA